MFDWGGGGLYGSRLLGGSRGMLARKIFKMNAPSKTKNEMQSMHQTQCIIIFSSNQVNYYERNGTVKKHQTSGNAKNYDFSQI